MELSKEFSNNIDMIMQDPVSPIAPSLGLHIFIVIVYDIHSWYVEMTLWVVAIIHQ